MSGLLKKIAKWLSGSGEGNNSGTAKENGDPAAQGDGIQPDVNENSSLEVNRNTANIANPSTSRGRKRTRTSTVTSDQMIQDGVVESEDGGSPPDGDMSGDVEIPDEEPNHAVSTNDSTNDSQLDTDANSAPCDATEESNSAKRRKVDVACDESNDQVGQSSMQSQDPIPAEQPETTTTAADHTSCSQMSQDDTSDAPAVTAEPENSQTTSRVQRRPRRQTRRGNTRSPAAKRPRRRRR